MLSRIHKKTALLCALAFGILLVIVFLLQLRFVSVSTTQETDHWQTYRNEQFGFSIQYPSTVEVVNRTNLLHEAGKYYTNPLIHPFLYVCFRSIAHPQSSCEFEFIVAPEQIKELLTPYLFLGFQRCSEKKEEIYRTNQPVFDGKNGIEVWICADGKVINRNALIENEGYTYLFTSKPLWGNAEMDQDAVRKKSALWQEMLSSFRWQSDSAPTLLK